MNTELKKKKLKQKLSKIRLINDAYFYYLCQNFSIYSSDILLGCSSRYILFNQTAHVKTVISKGNPVHFFFFFKKRVFNVCVYGQTSCCGCYKLYASSTGLDPPLILELHQFILVWIYNVLEILFRNVG